jgi:CBS domain-containing protein
MLRAKDIMKNDVVSVRRETPIFEAAELMVSNGISGMPVVEDDMTVAGILSEKDTILLFYEGREAEHKTVSDFMTCPAVTFEERESVLSVCDFLAKNIFRRVPITSNGKLIGIISIQDVLDCVLQKRQQAVSAN